MNKEGRNCDEFQIVMEEENVKSFCIERPKPNRVCDDVKESETIKVIKSTGTDEMMSSIELLCSVNWSCLICWTYVIQKEIRKQTCSYKNHQKIA